MTAKALFGFIAGLVFSLGLAGPSGPSRSPGNSRGRQVVQHDESGRRGAGRKPGPGHRCPGFGLDDVRERDARRTRARWHVSGCGQRPQRYGRQLLCRARRDGGVQQLLCPAAQARARLGLDLEFAQWIGNPDALVPFGPIRTLWLLADVAGVTSDTSLPTAPLLLRSLRPFSANVWNRNRTGHFG